MLVVDHTCLISCLILRERPADFVDFACKARCILFSGTIAAASTGFGFFAVDADVIASMLLPVIMLDAHQFRFAGRLGNTVPALDVTAEFPLRVPVNGADSCLLLKYSTLGLLAAPKGTVGRARTCASPTDMLDEREGTGLECAGVARFGWKCGGE